MATILSSSAVAIISLAPISYLSYYSGFSGLVRLTDGGDVCTLRFRELLSMTSVVRGKFAATFPQATVYGLKVTMERTRLNGNRNLVHARKLFSAHHKRQYEWTGQIETGSYCTSSKQVVLTQDIVFGDFPANSSHASSCRCTRSFAGVVHDGSLTDFSHGFRRRQAPACRCEAFVNDVSLDSRCTPWWQTLTTIPTYKLH